MNVCSAHMHVPVPGGVDRVLSFCLVFWVKEMFLWSKTEGKLKRKFVKNTKANFIAYLKFTS